MPNVRAALTLGSVALLWLGSPACSPAPLSANSGPSNRGPEAGRGGPLPSGPGLAQNPAQIQPQPPPAPATPSTSAVHDSPSPALASSIAQQASSSPPPAPPPKEDLDRSRRVKAASYLNAVHNKIHPQFADGYLASLEKLPPTDPLNGKLVTEIEVTMDSRGNLLKIAFLKPRGARAFDDAVLQSLKKAKPFRAPPPELLDSSDHFRFSWQFHRDPDVACTTANARPLSLPEP